MSQVINFSNYVHGSYIDELLNNPFNKQAIKEVTLEENGAKAIINSLYNLFYKYQNKGFPTGNVFLHQIINNLNIEQEEGIYKEIISNNNLNENSIYFLSTLYCVINMNTPILNKLSNSDKSEIILAYLKGINDSEYKKDDKSLNNLILMNLSDPSLFDKLLDKYDEINKIVNIFEDKPLSTFDKAIVAANIIHDVDSLFDYQPFLKSVSLSKIDGTKFDIKSFNSIELDLLSDGFQKFVNKYPVEDLIIFTNPENEFLYKNIIEESNKIDVKLTNQKHNSSNLFLEWDNGFTSKISENGVVEHYNKDHNLNDFGSLPAVIDEFGNHENYFDGNLINKLKI